MAERLDQESLQTLLVHHLERNCLVDFSSVKSQTLDRQRLRRADPQKPEDIQIREEFLQTTSMILSATSYSDSDQARFLNCASFWYVAPFYDKVGLAMELFEIWQIPASLLGVKLETKKNLPVTSE